MAPERAPLQHRRAFLLRRQLTAWAGTQHEPDGNGIGILFEGSCSRVRTLNTALHVVINALSSVLLAGSNYCMQCLSAPTRSQMPIPTQEPESFSSLARLGLGGVATRILLETDVTSSGTRGMMGNVVLVNTPHLCLASEWASFARERKGLRVSSKPTGVQRSQHFLQLPYRFGVPLLVFPGGLHWQISQSIFLVQVDEYDNNGQAVLEGEYGGPGQSGSFTTCGWSPLSVGCTISAGALLVLLPILFGILPFPSGLPVAGSCSAAIAAACHQTPSESESWDKPLELGVPANKETGPTSADHCFFSSNEMRYPEKGRWYS
ncbi:hypothetical protein C8A05DRAFT_46749 [Staphylotrichum tortipilum]|uniref:DUF6536 domain-containing protein n=1 Tax=Staphylotrichum tortipilum TaxID=2831512 RepID=A0AAN6RQU8_9PEZI|nr:hypothetical protein C8A05DRAFT_46749 [Staphylotrichum longicolle]